MCPVTGKLKKVEQKVGEKVRDGCVTFDEKYLHAAARAGLGDQNGMYSHIGVISRHTKPSLQKYVPVSRGGSEHRKPNIRQMINGIGRTVQSEKQTENKQWKPEEKFKG